MQIYHLDSDIRMLSTKQNLNFVGYFIYEVLEIKPCGLGSRIRDMEAESHN